MSLNFLGGSALSSSLRDIRFRGNLGTNKTRYLFKGDCEMKEAHTKSWRDRTSPKRDIRKLHRFPPLHLPVRLSLNEISLKCSKLNFPSIIEAFREQQSEGEAQGTRVQWGLEGELRRKDRTFLELKKGLNSAKISLKY